MEAIRILHASKCQMYEAKQGQTNSRPTVVVFDIVLETTRVTLGSIVSRNKIKIQKLNNKSVYLCTETVEVIHRL